MLEADEDNLFEVVVSDDEAPEGNTESKDRGRSEQRGARRKRGHAPARGSGKKRRTQESEEEAEEQWDPPPPPVSGRKRQTAKHLSTMAGWKKCKQCAKHKEHKCYNADQAKCRDCFNDNRSLQRVSEHQECREDLDKLKTENPKEHEAVTKAFCKAREQAKKSASKLIFSIKTFRMTYRSSSGVRKEEQGEMMWEGEYMEFAQTAKAGFLTKAEAEANWARFLVDDDVEKDKFGPRNFKRCWVKVRDSITRFDEVAKDKELSQEEKLGKKTTAEQMRTKLKQLLGSTGLDAHDPMAFDDLMGAVRKCMGSAGSSSVFEGDGVLAPDVSSMMKDVHAKRRGTKRKAEGESQDDDEESSESANGEGNCPKSKEAGGKLPTPKKAKQDGEGEWFDEAKARKAERAYLAAVTALQESMAETEQSMKTSLAEFRSRPEDAKVGSTKLAFSAFLLSLQFDS